MDDHVIPPLSGVYEPTTWVQPSRQEILVGEHEAIMPLSTLSCLREYNTTIPSGVYQGKMWRRRNHKEGAKWLLCWFGIAGPNGETEIHYRPIQVMDWKALMGVK